MIGTDLVAALERAAAAPILLVASDYDGTLSPLVDDPSLAVPLEAAFDALVELGRLPGVHAVIISGRSRAALEQLTGSPPDVTLVGTHGAELPGSSAARPDRGVAAVVDGLARVADTFEGTRLEAKPHGAALHYRTALQPEEAAAAALAVGEGLGVRIIHGKMVVELLVGDGDKGSAVDELRRRAGATSVVFLGDDTTDEDVFARLRDVDIGVKVGEGATLARHRVDGPEDVGDVLGIVLAARRRPALPGVNGEQGTHPDAG